MNIGEAVESAKAGNTVRRTEWPPEYGVGVTYKESEEYSDPLFFMTLTNGQNPPWSPSHRDLEATDWEDVTV
jgi:hypothetical protein